MTISPAESDQWKAIAQDFTVRLEGSDRQHERDRQMRAAVLRLIQTVEALQPFYDQHTTNAAETRYLMLYRSLTPFNRAQVDHYMAALSTPPHTEETK